MLEVIGIIVGIVVLILLFRLFFGDIKGFLDSVCFWITPDIFSLARGRYGADILAEMKLFVWLACGGGAGFSVYKGLLKLLS